MPANISWIDDILAEVEHEVETPRSWLWWSLVTAISAAAANNYTLRTLSGNVIYKPNLYVMLLGTSGLGKGYGINLAKLLVQKSESTRVIAGRSSIQAIVNEISKVQTSEKTGALGFRDSRAFVVNGELSSAIIADVDSLAILTDLYDGHYNTEWNNTLKISGKESVRNPYITTLFGSSPAHFYDSIPSANIEGGYLARNLVVYEESRSRNIDLLDDDESENDKLKEYIVPKYGPHLKFLHDNEGRVIANPAAKLSFNSWRMKWRTNPIPDKTGFINRVPDHVLKVAMCLCLARYNSGGVITEFDMRESIDAVTSLVYANKLSAEGRGLDPAAGQSKAVLDLLLKADNQELKRKNLLAQGHGNFDAFALDRILETLSEMGWVRVEIIRAGPATDKLIVLSGEPKENYLKWKASQNGR
jgi:hypothetical protein